jgi:hypothetical protein
MSDVVFTNMCITVTAVFLSNFFSHRIYIYLMHNLRREENIPVKRAHKRFLNSAGGVTRAYDSDRGRFSDNGFIEIVVPNNNKQMNCGVGGHY